LVAASAAGISVNSNSPAISPEVQDRLQELINVSQRIMAHAWMVRTFVKHSDEVEDYPELNEMARSIFDTFRALETQVDNAESYFRFLRKKLGKLKAASVEFEKNAWHASTHTNFQQAVISIVYVVEQLEAIRTEADALLPAPAPPKIQLPTKPGGSAG
jgi:hypothetical protein